MSSTLHSIYHVTYIIIDIEIEYHIQNLIQYKNGKLIYHSKKIAKKSFLMRKHINDDPMLPHSLFFITNNNHIFRCKKF